jgi:hypothetical protein
MKISQARTIFSVFSQYFQVLLKKSNWEESSETKVDEFESPKPHHGSSVSMSFVS